MSNIQLKINKVNGEWIEQRIINIFVEKGVLKKNFFQIIFPANPFK